MNDLKEIKLGDKFWIEMEVVEDDKSRIPYRIREIRENDNSKFRGWKTEKSMQSILDNQPDITFTKAHDFLRDDSTLSDKSFDLYWNAIADDVELSELVPERVKPTIPRFIANYIDWFQHDFNHMFKEDYEYIVWMVTVPEEYADFEKVREWRKKSGNAQKINDAYRYGYEIEKEPKWVVKSEHSFLERYNFRSDFPNRYTFGPNKELAIKFNKKEIADAIAELTEGTVEEVTT